MDDTVGLREAAELLGVHYMTAYRYVRLGQLPARKEGAEWRVARADLEAMRGGAEKERSARSAAPWSERLESRLLAGDQAGAWAVVEGAMVAGTEPARIYTELIGPALRRIGRRWANGEVSVADEHLASGVAGRLIGRLGPRFARPGRGRGVVLLALPPGDRHGFGLEMLADILAGAGFEPVNLGADVPLADLAERVARADRLVAVCIGAVVGDNDRNLGRAVATARRAAGPDVPILVGGPAVAGEAEAIALGADGWAADGLAAVQVVEESLSV